MIRVEGDIIRAYPVEIPGYIGVIETDEVHGKKSKTKNNTTTSMQS